MRKDIFLPGLALVGGLAGFGLRLWQLRCAYRPDLGLFVHGAAATYALIALCVLVAALLLAGVCTIKEGPEEFLPAFGCPLPGQMTVLAASGLLFLAAAALGVREGLYQLQLWRAAFGPGQGPGLYTLPYPFALLLCAGLCVPAGLGMLLLGKAAYRGELSSAASRLAPFPACAGLVWLFVTHLSNGTQPVLMRYVLQLAAACLLMLGLYYCAGFLFGRPCRRRGLFCCLSGAAAGIACLADRPNLFTCALTAAFVPAALALSWALLRNTCGPAWPQRLEGQMPPRAEEGSERDT